jgi:hypothetical protein
LCVCLNELRLEIDPCSGKSANESLGVPGVGPEVQDWKFIFHRMSKFSAIYAHSLIGSSLFLSRVAKGFRSRFIKLFKA